MKWIIRVKNQELLYSGKGIIAYNLKNWWIAFLQKLSNVSTWNEYKVLYKRNLKSFMIWISKGIYINIHNKKLLFNEINI